MSENAKWYVVHTYSSYENKVKTNLEKIIENRNLYDVITQVSIPMGIFTEIKDNEQKEVERKKFPGYVLVKMVLDDDTWFIVRNVRGVTGFVGPSSSKPVPLTDEEVAALGVETIEKYSAEVSCAVGDNVEIIDGSLASLIGTVTFVDAAESKVKLKVSMFGRETEVELLMHQVRKI